LIKRRVAIWLISALIGLGLLLRGGVLLDSLFINLGWITSVKTNTETTQVAVPIADAWQTCRSWDAVGFGKFLRGHTTAAIDNLRQASKCDEYRRAWFDLGRAQFSAGLIDEAAESWRKADAYEYAVQMDARLSNGKDPAQLIKARQFLVKAGPDQSGAYIALADAYRAAQCPVEALQTYQVALSLKIDEANRKNVQAQIDQINKIKVDNSKCLLPK
jgi:tetratricopeptide (TPR) repeat protein